MGERALTLTQYGMEAVGFPGVPVPANMRIALKVAQPIRPDRTPSFPEEDFGARAKSVRSQIGQHLVSDTLTFDDAYYEMLPLMFSCGLRGSDAAIGPDANGLTGWDWKHEVLMRGNNAPDSFTLEVGDDDVQYQCTYGMFERINIKGTINQGSEASPVTVTGDFFAREWEEVGLTPNLEPIVTWPLNAKLSTLNISDTWANMQTGAVLIEKTLRAFDIDIITGLHPKMLGSGLKTFDTHGQGIIHVTSAFTFEGIASASTEYGHYLTQEDRAYRLTITNEGSDPNSVLRIDCFGRWSEVIPFADEDRGNNLFTLVHESILDPLNFDPAPDMLEVLVTNQTPALW